MRIAWKLMHGQVLDEPWLMHGQFTQEAFKLQKTKTKNLF